MDIFVPTTAREILSRIHASSIHCRTPSTFARVESPSNVGMLLKEKQKNICGRMPQADTADLTVFGAL
jgi:hypothetical protein